VSLAATVIGWKWKNLDRPFSTWNTKVCSRFFVSGSAVCKPWSADFIPSVNMGYEKQTSATRTVISTKARYWTNCDLATVTHALLFDCCFVVFTFYLRWPTKFRNCTLYFGKKDICYLVLCRNSYVFIISTVAPINCNSILCIVYSKSKSSDFSCEWQVDPSLVKLSFNVFKLESKHDEFDDRIVQGIQDMLLFVRQLLKCILLYTMWYGNYLVLIRQCQHYFLFISYK